MAQTLIAFCKRHSWYAAGCLMAALYAIALGFSLIHPAYIDDVFYLMSKARLGYDNWQNIRFKAECGNEMVSVPVTLFPSLFLSWTAHALADSYYGMRVVSICIWTATIAYLVTFVKLCIAPKLPIFPILIISLSFLGLGNLPFATLIYRQEPLIFLLVLFYASIPFWTVRYPNISTTNLFYFSIVFLLASSCLASSHQKAIFFLPLVALSVLYIARWNKTASIILAITTIIITYNGITFWLMKMDCPASKAMAIKGSYKYVSLMVLMEQPMRFLKAIWLNISLFDSYVSGLLFPKLGILAKADSYTAQETISWFIRPLMYATAIFALIGSKVMLWHAWCHRSWKHPAVMTSLCLVAALLLQLGIQSKQSFYNAVLIWLNIVLIALFVAHYLYATARYIRSSWLVAACGIAFCISLVSQIILIIIYIPATLKVLEEAEPSGRMQNHYALISPLDYDEKKERILKVAAMCNIEPDASSKYLSLDIYTYLPLKHTYHPSMVTFKFQEDQSPKGFLAFLRSKQSDGLIRRCGSLPRKIRAIAQKEGDICCISKQQIMTYGNPQNFSPIIRMPKL